MKLKKVPGLFAVFMAVLIITSCSKVDKDYYENGNLKSELPYKNGKLNGTARWYYEDGVIQLEVPYVDDQIEGVNTRYHDNGKKESEEKYVGNIRQGKAVAYSYSGKRIEQKYYVDDTLHGIYRKWHGNGELQITGELVHGLYEGTWLYYNEYGDLIGEGKYKAGKGMQRFWYPNGAMKSRTSYQNNLKHGIEYNYFEDGSVNYSVEYFEGELLENTSL